METTVMPLETISVRDWMQANGFVQVYKEVRVNENGYPYVTFINADNKAENVYFSKNESKTHHEGMAIERGFFDNLQIADVANADGEVRTKLVGLNSNRIGVEDLF